MRYAFILLAVTLTGIAHAGSVLQLPESTNKIVSRVFPKDLLSTAILSEKMIKLRFDGESPKGDPHPIFLKGSHQIKILLGAYKPETAKFLVIAESLAGDLEPVVINSEVTNLRYLNVRLPLGDMCKNQKYLVTALQKVNKTLYWNKRAATIPIADCNEN